MSEYVNVRIKKPIHDDYAADAKAENRSTTAQINHVLEQARPLGPSHQKLAVKPQDRINRRKGVRPNEANQ